MREPIICPLMYAGTFDQGKSPIEANPKVTAGFKCASDTVPETNIPIVTASPHPTVITIQPASSAFDHLSKTPPTTPTPNITNTIVPKSSAKNSLICIPPFSKNIVITPKKTHTLIVILYANSTNIIAQVTFLQHNDKYELIFIIKKTLSLVNSFFFFKVNNVLSLIVLKEFGVIKL